MRRRCLGCAVRWVSMGFKEASRYPSGKGSTHLKLKNILNRVEFLLISIRTQATVSLKLQNTN
jgi:hypothetical protein